MSQVPSSLRHCQQDFCAAVTEESPHRAASGSLLPFLAGISSHVEAELLVCLQRTEATTAAAGLSCFPLPDSYQTSVQGQSCCGSRHRYETSWKRTVRPVPMQVIFHLRCVCDEDFFHLWSPHWNRFQLPGKLDDWEAEGRFQALLMPSQETVTKYVIFGITVLQLRKK